MFTATEQGSPQGGVISPLLMNVALHGLEEAAGVCYRRVGVHAGKAAAGSPILVRYADDLVVCCYTRQQVDQVKARLADWLRPRVWSSTRTRRALSISMRASTSSGSICAATGADPSPPSC